MVLSPLPEMTFFPSDETHTEFTLWKEKENNNKKKSVDQEKEQKKKKE
jgi:hypothetical protein